MPEHRAHRRLQRPRQHHLHGLAEDHRRARVRRPEEDQPPVPVLRRPEGDRPPVPVLRRRRHRLWSIHR